MIRLCFNTYVDPNFARNQELHTSVDRNRSNPYLGGILAYPGRPTFYEMLSYVGSASEASDIAIIANSDIYFDATVELMESISPGECYALSRWDMTNGKPILFDRQDSCDAWCFRGPPPKIDAPFTSGVRGCDNRLCALIEDAGYKILNPSRDIRAIHLHESAVRRYPPKVVQGRFVLVAPHHLGESPKRRSVIYPYNTVPLKDVV